MYIQSTMKKKVHKQELSLLLVTLSKELSKTVWGQIVSLIAEKLQRQNAGKLKKIKFQWGSTTNTGWWQTNHSHPELEHTDLKCLKTTIGLAFHCSRLKLNFIFRGIVSCMHICINSYQYNAAKIPPEWGVGGNIQVSLCFTFPGLADFHSISSLSIMQREVTSAFSGVEEY